MKPLVSSLLVLASLISVTASLALEPANDRIVVMISIDGLSHYYFDDPKAEMPTIRRLAAEGARAERMKCSMPTVTWPNHTTLVTGVHPARHGVLGNYVFDRAEGKPLQLIVDPILNKDEIVTSPTIYDLAHEAGLKTASIIWPATRGAKTIDWCLPEVVIPELIETHTTPGLLDELGKAGIPYRMKVEWHNESERGRARDRLFVQMFTYLIGEHRPNLGLLHLVNLDAIQHGNGPNSPKAYDTIKFQDRMVAEVWTHLQVHFPERATLLIVSDHGFFPYYQRIYPNIFLHQEGLLEIASGKISGGKVRAVAQSGACFIYILDEEYRDTLLEKLAEDFRGLEGIERVITPEEFDDYGLAHPEDNPHMADLVLSAKEGYTFSSAAGGKLVVSNKSEKPRGSHGYDPNEDKMHASFVAWGAGITPGTTLGTISNTSVAPTIATLLDLEMKDTDGPVLHDILSK